MRRISILAVCAMVLSSCGGGGGGIVHPATTFRANQVGDIWLYSVAINFGQFGAYTGTLTDSLTSDTYNGQPSIRNTQTFNLLLNTGPSTITSYSEISPQGVLLADMVSAVLYPVTSDTFSTGSTIGSTTSDSGVITLSNGETITETYKVIGTEVVQTQVGSFACWIVKQTVVNSNGVKDDFTIWMAPETGNYVRIDDTTQNPDGTGYTYTASLTSIVTPTSQNREAGSLHLLGHLPKLGQVQLSFFGLPIHSH